MNFSQLGGEIHQRSRVDELSPRDAVELWIKLSQLMKMPECPELQPYLDAAWQSKAKKIADI